MDQVEKWETSENFEIRIDNEINKSHIRSNIVKLQSIIDKFIQLEYPNEKQQKQREFFRNNSERAKGYFEGLDLFSKINQNKIKISLDKKVLNWGFNFEIYHENNFPRIALDLYVQTFNQISFGKTENTIPKRLMSYDARDMFIKKISDDLKAKFNKILNQGSIKVLQGQSR